MPRDQYRSDFLADVALLYLQQRPTLRHYRVFLVTQQIAMKVCKAIRELEDNGWFLVRIRGSHRQFKHPVISSLVTLSGKRSQDIPIGTLRRILKLCRQDEVGASAGLCRTASSNLSGIARKK